MSFTCAGRRFDSVAIARKVVVDGWEHVPAAIDGTGGCRWLIRDVYRDADGWPEEQIVDCGAEVAVGDDGWICAAGHEHVSMEAQERLGIAYAEDAYDAAVIARGGRTPVPMGPETAIDEREAAHIMSTL